MTTLQRRVEREELGYRDSVQHLALYHKALFDIWWLGHQASVASGVAVEHALALVISWGSDRKPRTRRFPFFWGGGGICGFRNPKHILAIAGMLSHREMILSY